ncbi:hypothetical protein [Pseudomonas putida]|uniref:hypothetical protein n=1 Tax=Pseudomonas putida TaxID=303 RepID=UPI0023646381|nr:hypothetical protein [Pseudomonas putida]MDD2005068.1 hypothetical protein [Pseudomonas putida]
MSRTRMLDKKLLKDIVKGVERTSTVELACAIANISEAAFYKWQARGRELLDAQENGDHVEPADEIYVEFVESVERARYISCLPAVDTIQKAIKMGDVKAAEKFLSRRMPGQFGDYERKEVTIRSDSNTDDGTGIALIPSMGEDNDLDQLLQQQQSDAFLLAKTKTNELS